MKKPESKKKILVQSLERALDILEIVQCSAEPVKAADIARKAGLGNNTAHNLIRTMFRRGYLSQDSSSRYFIGAKCYLLGSARNKWRIFIETIQPVLQKIAEDTGDSCVVGIESGGKLLLPAYIEGSGAIIIQEKQEWNDKFHCTAAGKVILAQKGLDWFKKIINSGTLPVFSPKTIADWIQLEKEIMLIAKQGYSVSIDETREGISAIAVPIFDSTGHFQGAIAQAFPTYFIETKKIIIRQRKDLLLAAAGQIRTSLVLSC
ncbi:MAG: hypothetical protein A2096_11705 [Spirochaetes bacterium GWF1_41_5]|nr:MAG: hypothetical protein A2096_11705 [Spirochaetes bacterium GWF1_41_5]HBE02693.1 hypothetical protein [Spirochaetia bacterium]